MDNYYIGSPEHPYHLSVGAIAIDAQGQICCHRYEDLSLWGHAKELGGCYVLMRETMELGETPESALCRGLMEEFGMTAEIISYIGSLRAPFRRRGAPPDIEKTTLYFLVRPETFDISKRMNDIENTSTIEWKSPKFLMSAMREQSVRFGRADIDEAAVVERALKFS